ncbi:MAG: serine/threonine-protein kinase, partial [Planctomycetota bacterium]|nr:serine/threonine-protein kinase [Planctomycetota bacterium]
KTLRPEHAQDVEYLKRFLGEARNAARLQHPNTVTIFQVGAKGDLAYLVMELVDGESLDKSVTPERSMEWREATRVIRDAAAGLAAAHEKGLVHRDIKPANLMRTTSGTTKVVDFGLARAQTANSHLTQQGMLLGTPQYMAPELWAGAEADPRSDVYALLVCYYYLLTGRVPFDAPSLPVLGYRHRYDPLPDPRQSAKGLPDAACRILGRGLAKDPARRYQRCDELVAELEALLSSPQASLTFESSWAVLVGEHTAVTPPPVIQVVSTPPLPSPARVRNPRGNPLSWAARRAWRALRGVGPAVRKSVLSLARRASEGGASEGEAPKFPRWRVGLVCLASLAMLGIVVYVTTGSGTVKIELSDPNAEVQVQVDGDTIDITGLKEPLRLRVGAHELEVSCTEFQTLTKSFTVRRGQEDVVKVTLQPVPPALPLAEKPAPAVYSVTVDPPTAKVAVAGKGASIEGSGASRTITVTGPDGQGKVLVMASLAGYDTQEQEIQPERGISRQLSLQLKLLPPPLPPPAPQKAKPAVYSVTVDPPTAKVLVTGKGARIEGVGPSRTITVTEPDGQDKVVVMASLTGYGTQEQELQPQPGTLRQLSLQLTPAPAVYTVTVDPPSAVVSVTGRGASIEGSGPSRTITVTEPDGQGKVLVVAGLLGTKRFNRSSNRGAACRGRCRFNCNHWRLGRCSRTPSA